MLGKLNVKKNLHDDFNQSTEMAGSLLPEEPGPLEETPTPRLRVLEDGDSTVLPSAHLWRGEKMGVSREPGQSTSPLNPG